jgi:hypothetical protein
MLRSLKALEGYDRDWAVRYMVADTGGWLAGRQVLISPMALLQPEWETRRFPVALTRQQVEDSPPLDADAPVSRAYEIQYHRFYALPFYWMGPDLWGTHPDPAGVIRPVPQAPEPDPEDLEVGEGHLRSCREVSGYEVQARDGGTATMEDFVADDSSWRLQFAVVDTRAWLPGGRVLIPTGSIEAVDWTHQRVLTSLAGEEIRNAPTYDPRAPINLEYERRLDDFYGRPRS